MRLPWLIAGLGQLGLLAVAWSRLGPSTLDSDDYASSNATPALKG